MYFVVIDETDLTIAEDKFNHDNVIPFEDIHNHYGKGELICEFDAAMSSFGELFPLFSKNTVERFDLPVTGKLLEYAFSRGHINFLNKYKSMLYLCSHRAVDMACQHGQIESLEWWSSLDSTFRNCLKYTSDAIDRASANGHVDVLEWWDRASKQLGLPAKYSSDAIDMASINEEFKSLNWWISSGWFLKYTTDAVDLTSSIKVLNWWKNTCLELSLPFRYSTVATRHASDMGLTEVLDWWFKQSQLLGWEFKYDENAVDFACEKGYTDVLEWWRLMDKNHGFKFKFTKSALKNAIREGHDFVIRWFEENLGSTITSS